MTELWLTRDEDGEVGIFNKEEPSWNVKYKYWATADGLAPDFYSTSLRECRALGLPTIRKGTKKRVRVTWEIVK